MLPWARLLAAGGCEVIAPGAFGRPQGKGGTGGGRGAWAVGVSLQKMCA